MQITALLTCCGNNTMKDKYIRQVNRKPLLYCGDSAAKRSTYITNFFINNNDKIVLFARENIASIKCLLIYLRLTYRMLTRLNILYPSYKKFRKSTHKQRGLPILKIFTLLRFLKYERIA